MEYYFLGFPGIGKKSRDKNTGQNDTGSGNPGSRDPGTEPLVYTLPPLRQHLSRLASTACCLLHWTCHSQSAYHLSEALKSVLLTFTGASKCHRYLRKSTDLVPLGKGSPLWLSLFVGQCSCSCELGTATLPWVLYVERPLWAGFARGTGSHSRHCHRVPQRVILYAFLSCLWRMF